MSGPRPRCHTAADIVRPRVRSPRPPLPPRLAAHSATGSNESWSTAVHTPGKRKQTKKKKLEAVFKKNVFQRYASHLKSNNIPSDSFTLNF